MKRLAAFLLGTLVAGCASATTKSHLEFRKLHEGAYATASNRSPSVVIARDADAYRRIWNILIAPTAPPKVDFARESVVFILDQERPTGGYSLTAQSVALQKGKAIVKVASHHPGRGTVAAQVLTSPFVVVAVAKPNLASAEWVDAESGKPVAHDATPQDKSAAQ